MKTLKLLLSVLLLLCLFDMPYGYYQLVRWASLVCFILFGMEYFAKENKSVGIAMFALAILFQPFIKIALGKSLWNIVDVAVAVFLLILLVVEQRNNHIVYSTGKEEKEDYLTAKVENVLKEAGLNKFPSFRISGYTDTSTCQLGPEYVTIDLKVMPSEASEKLEPQLKKLISEKKRFMVCRFRGELSLS